jgi:hypothetical protein
VYAWRAGFSAGHVVLIGESNVAAALAVAFRKADRHVVAVTRPAQGDNTSLMEQSGAQVVFGDVRREATLKRAAIHRAELAIVADDVDADGVLLASSVARLCRRYRGRDAGRLDFLVRLGHRDLRSLMRTQISAAVRDSLVDLRLYVRERTIARSLLARYPADWGQPPGPHDIHAAIVGMGYMGSELLLQLTRIAVPSAGRRCVFTVVDQDAFGLRDQLLAEHPGIDNRAGTLRFFQSEISPSAISADQVARWFEAYVDGQQPIAATAIYLCCGDDGVNLSMAISLRKAYARRGAAAPPIFVYQNAGRELVEGLADLHGAAFDTLRIIPFGGIEEEADPFYLTENGVDRLARELHASYVARQREKGNHGAAIVPWESLDPTYRAANRALADHVLVKLRAAGLHAAPGGTGGQNSTLDDAVLETLAIQEHDRWSRDRRLAGWTHAEKRDNEKLHHPDLVPFDELGEDARNKDRDAIRDLACDLGALGLSLKRDLRVGLWFEGKTEPSAQLLAAIKQALAAIAPGSHLQLVLPLRDPAELGLASDLGRAGNCGVDVVLLRSAATPGSKLGERIEEMRSAVGRLISVADRAFVLTTAAGDAGPAGEIAPLALLSSVCDRVLLACETKAAGEAIVHQLEPTTEDKIACVSPRTLKGEGE